MEINPFCTTLAKTSHYTILVCLMPDDFTPSNARPFYLPGVALGVKGLPFADGTLWYQKILKRAIR